MTTLPIWALLLAAVFIAIAMYFLGGLKKTARSHRAGYEAGHYQGYYDGYADCLARARSCAQPVESEAGDVQ